MLVRLTRDKRLKAGWLLALTYLLCMLAPSLSFAFADGSRLAPCIIEYHGPGMHMHETTVDQQGHNAGFIHDHTHGQSMQQGATMADEDRGSIPVKGQKKSSDMRCCGLVFLSAIPAGLIVLVKPSVLTSICEAENYRNVAGNAAPRLYRPPIS